MDVRDARCDDLGAICDLFNALILTTTIGWRDDPSTIEEQSQWFAEREARGHPTLVADDGGQVVAYCCWSDFRGGVRFPGYRHTVEHSVHVAATHQRRGVGRLLMTRLMDRARTNEIHAMGAGVDAENQRSIDFHLSLGFVEVARMPETGRKFDRWLDLVLLQKIL